MQAALLLRNTGPAAGSRIFSWMDGSCAVSAANARVIEIMQRIVGDIVLADVCPDFIDCPVNNWVDLDDLELGVPFDFARLRTSSSLISPDSRDPSIQAL